MEENALVKSTNKGVNFFDEHDLVVAQRSCKMLTSSELVPKMYQSALVGDAKATANCMIALDMASRTGANPLMIMQNLYVVQGHPSFSSAFLVGTINTCGRYDTLKYKTGIIEGGVRNKNGQIIPNVPNYYCYAYTWERGQKFLSEKDKEEQKLQSTTITMQMAVDEGWYDKPGSKWRTMPSQMLKYRAAAFWCRAFAPELSMGMHTTEEVKDGIVDDVEFDEEINNTPIANEPVPTTESQQVADSANDVAAKLSAKAARKAAEEKAGEAFTECEAEVPPSDGDLFNQEG